MPDVKTWGELRMKDGWIQDPFPFLLLHRERRTVSKLIETSECIIFTNDFYLFLSFFNQSDSILVRQFTFFSSRRKRDIKIDLRFIRSNFSPSLRKSNQGLFKHFLQIAQRMISNSQPPSRGSKLLPHLFAFFNRPFSSY